MVTFVIAYDFIINMCLRVKTIKKRHEFIVFMQ